MDKRLREDPRVLRMAKSLRNALLIERNADSNAPHAMTVTLVCGALYVLWSYADSHIRSDDTLGLGVDEINQLVGIDRFCEIMPAEWLEIVNAESVKLPKYQSHNGASEKQRANNAQRQAKWRHSNALRNGQVTSNKCDSNDAISNLTKPKKKNPAQALPDKPKANPKSPLTSVPDDFALDPELEQYAVDRLPEVDPAALIESFRGKAKAKDWRYSNWRQAFQEFVRNSAPNSGHWASGQYPRKKPGGVYSDLPVQPRF